MQVAAAASQTEEDVSVSKQLLHIALKEVIHQFLVHTIDIKRNNLADKLATNGVLSRCETQKIREQKKPDAKVRSLLVMLKEKSGAQFESFMATLSDEGQQTVADVVRQALHTVHRPGQNPLQSGCGKTCNVL